MQRHNKLVRDGIIDKIHRNGEVATWRTLGDHEFRFELLVKLIEESNELAQAACEKPRELIVEAADCHTVFGYVCAEWCVGHDFSRVRPVVEITPDPRQILPKLAENVRMMRHNRHAMLPVLANWSKAFDMCLDHFALRFSLYDWQKRRADELGVFTKRVYLIATYNQEEAKRLSIAASR